MSRTKRSGIVLLLIAGILAVVVGWILMMRAPFSPGLEPNAPNAPIESGARAPASAPELELSSQPTTAAAVSVAVPEVAPLEADATKTPSISGSVYDPAGALLPGSVVRVYWNNQESARSYKPTMVEVVTDAIGAYAIAGFSAGKLELLASHARYADSRRAMRIAATDALTGVDFRLESGLAIRGRVTDTQGRGLAGVHVIARGERPKLKNDANPDHECVSEASGDFALTGLDQREYELVLKLRGYVTPPDAPSSFKYLAGTSDALIILEQGATISGTVRGPDGAIVEGARASADRPGAQSRRYGTKVDGEMFEIASVPAGAIEVIATAGRFLDSEPHALHLNPGQVVTGVELRLRTGVEISGTVVDTEGAPIEGAMVMASESSPAARNLRRMGESSNAQGVFVFKGLEAGKFYEIAASFKGTLATPSASMSAVAAGSAGVVLVLDRGASVSGIVRGIDGAPIAGATVDLRTKRESTEPVSIAETLTENITLADGSYRLSGFIGGAYNVTCSMAGVYPMVLREVAVAQHMQLTGVDFVLEPGGAITGEVQDDLGEPIADVRVSAFRTVLDGPGAIFEVHGTESDAAGAFAFNGLADEVYDVKISELPPGFMGSESSRTKSRPGNHVVLKLSTGVTFLGRVVDGHGDPVQQFTIRTYYGAKLPSGQSRSQDFITEDGSFKFPGNDLRIERLEIDSSAHLPASVNCSVLPAPGDHDLGVIVLENGASISGTVVDDDKNVVNGARVRAFMISESTYLVQPGREVPGERRASTDAAGSFTIEHLPTGMIAVEAAREGSRSGVLVVALDPGRQREDIVLAIAALGSISGIVHGADAEPMSGTSVSLSGGNDSRAPVSSFTMTDSGGAYRFSALAPGDYSVAIQANERISSGARSYTFARQWRQVRVTAGADVRCDFSSEATCRVFGSVAAPAGCDRGAVITFQGAGITLPATIGEDGAYERKEVPAGEYEVLIAGGRAGVITVPDASEARFDFTILAGHVSGVVEATGGALPAGITIVFRQAVAPPMRQLSELIVAVEPGPDFSATVPVGRYEVQASAGDELESSVTTIDVTSGGVDGLVLVLDALGDVKVDLSSTLDLGGRVHIACISSTGRILGSVFQEFARGHATSALIEDLPVGPAHIVAVSELRGYAWQAVVIPAGGEVAIALIFGAGDARARIVTTRGGVPLDPGRATLTAAGGAVLPAPYGNRLYDAFHPRSSGGCLTPPLPAGDYLVRAADGGAFVERSITVPASGEVEVLLEIP